MQITPDIQVDFNEQIALFFQRGKSKAEAQKQLDQHCNEMLAQLPQMLPVLSEYPVYAGIAFHGKMQIGDRKLIARLASTRTSAEEAVAAIRCQKALKVAASAKSGWDFLLQNDQEALWSAIQLNAGTVKVKKAAVEEDEEEDCQDCDDDDNDDAEHLNDDY